MQSSKKYFMHVFAAHHITCREMMSIFPCIFCVLLDKTKICKLWEEWCVTCQNISVQKTGFF
jgi:hypothetical protein